MNASSLKIKFATLFALACSSQASAMTSNMTHRVMSTSPLFFKMIDYSQHEISYEVAPIFSTTYDTTHINQNLILGGKNSLIFDQQGQGDFNPFWLNLQSSSIDANYHSDVTFTPKLRQAGVMLQWFEQFDTTFINIKTAIMQCTSQVEITEVGGGTGALPGIFNVEQAFNQSSFNYGHIGQSSHVAGLDNIEVRVGAFSQIPHTQDSCNMFFSGFGIIEMPTGSGTHAQSLFEPQVGTNHWGLGLGVEGLLAYDNLKFMIGANARYLTPAWETRSFDLTENGQWSRYLSLQNIYNLPGPEVLGMPGINVFTQPAYINGRSQFNVYARLAQQINSCLFELSYNYFYQQAETISQIKQIPSGYGIYGMNGPSGGGGGITTASDAMINQDYPPLDTPPVEVTTSMLNKMSAVAGSYSTNNLTARIEKVDETFIYGIGASIEVAQSASALSTWSVWAKFEFLFDN